MVTLKNSLEAQEDAKTHDDMSKFGPESATVFLPKTHETKNKAHLVEFKSM